MLSIWTWLLVLVAAFLAAIYFVIKNFARIRRPDEPLIVKGSLLWGSAAEFSKHAVKFLHAAHRQYGDVFTVRLVNQYLTIVMDPHSYEAVSREKNFDFDPIQKQVNKNVFSYALVDAKKMLMETSKTVCGYMLEEGIHGFVENLNLACDTVYPRRLNGGGVQGESATWAVDGLRHFTARTAFNAIFTTVFGRKEHVFNSEMVFNNFETFHKYFNYLWLGFPVKLFPKAIGALTELLQCPDADELLARPDISRYLRRAIEFMQSKDQTESDIKGHNLVYLHVNYNTFRLAFWALSNLLEDEKAYSELKKEVDELLTRRYDPETNVACLDMKDVEDLKILDSIVQETTRLSSGVFMVRYVTDDTYFETAAGHKYLIRQGDRVAIYPPALHKDPEIFEDPLVFKYDRFVDAKFYKNGAEVKHPVMGFGTLCPGKRYALLQLKWYLMTFITRFDMRLKPGQHAVYDTQYHGHEILPPVKDVDIEYRLKESFPVLEFIRRKSQTGSDDSADSDDAW